MKFLDYMSTAEGFARLMDQLALRFPDPELLEDPVLEEHPALVGFLQREWAQKRRPETDGVALGFVLLVAYHTGLLLERSRYGHKRYLRLGVLLLLGRHVWPIFEVWVGRVRPLPGRRSLSSSLTWFQANGGLTRALEELGVSNPHGGELQVSADDFQRDNSTLSKWLKQALLALYDEIRIELEMADPAACSSRAIREVGLAYTKTPLPRPNGDLQESIPSARSGARPLVSGRYHRFPQ
ncbi:MAG: hypothetical protein ABSF61_04150 [Anaerolineales bacterium]|jgi:hypothetical protein